MNTGLTFYTVNIRNAFDNIITYKILVPGAVSRKQVVEAFKMAEKYCEAFCLAINYNSYIASYYNMDPNKLRNIYKCDYQQYLKLGCEAFDEHFKEIENMSSHCPETIFKHYIGKCIGWIVCELAPDYIIICK